MRQPQILFLIIIEPDARQDFLQANLIVIPTSDVWYDLRSTEEESY